MTFNLFDVILIVIIAVAVIIGVIKGLVRQTIGIAAVILGVILAMRFFEPAAGVIGSVIRNKTLSKLLGFLAVFLGVIIIGGLVAWMVSKLMKGPFKFVNHVLGAALGLVEGILICGVIVLAQMLFPIDKTYLYHSQLAPYCARMVKIVYRLVPQDLKDNFNETYKKLVQKEKNLNE